MTERGWEESMGRPGGESEGVSVYWILAVLLRDRRLVLGCAGIGLLLGLTLGLLRKPTYTSSFSFLPQSTQDPGKAGLASLAGQFGISLGALGGASQPPQLYADLLLTREVLTPIARDSFPVGRERVPLSEFLDVSGTEPPVVLDNVLRELRKNVISTNVAARTTGMVTVSVRTESPHVSLKIAERLLQGLNRFNLVTRQSQAGEERRFTEARYAASRVSLREAEDGLQRFLQANRQYTNSPQLSFEKERLQREVSLRQQVVSTLAQQFEDARIREVRDTPVITVIEQPTLPARPDPRLRALIAVVATLAALAVGVLIVLLRSARNEEGRVERDPARELLAREWKRLRGAIAS
jgi:uncharacterized protein involved in exopolysaccharide biosynthesis